jgi:hypothetical protein
VVWKFPCDCRYFSIFHSIILHFSIDSLGLCIFLLYDIDTNYSDSDGYDRICDEFSVLYHIQ